MRIVEIPFHNDFREHLLNGRKSMTTRYDKKGEPGDRFFAFGEMFHIMSVRAVKLGDVAERYYRLEGTDSPEHFLSIWWLLHPKRERDLSAIVYAHSFIRIRDVPKDGSLIWKHN